MKEGERLRALVLAALEDAKAEDPVALDVRAQTSVTLYMIIASGRSDRHVRGIADLVAERVRAARAARVAEEASRDWVLLDLGDAVVHVMLPETRAFYSLEKLWTMPAAAARDAAA